MKNFLFPLIILSVQMPVVCSASDFKEIRNRALMCNFHHALEGRTTYPLLFEGILAREERFIYETRVLDNAFRILGVCISKDRVFRRQLKRLGFTENGLIRWVEASVFDNKDTDYFERILADQSMVGFVLNQLFEL